MSLDAQPIRFTPKGLSDTLDGTDAFPGAMVYLQDLVPDPSTLGVFYCRPAAVEKTAFAGVTVPKAGFVSVFKVIGSRIYGLVASSFIAGYDQPFCYDLSTSALVPIGGIMVGNVPASQSASGDWTPPTMDLVGTKLVVTHPGFVGTANKFGYFDLVAGTWGAGDTAVNPLPYYPTAVKQFNGRANFLVNPPGGQPGLVVTDSLDPLTRTNGTYVLTFGDNLPLTAVGALPLNNQLGGIVQALIVFKGVSNMVQVTGDPALNTWSANTLNVATGTLSPRSVVSTPKGLGFMSPDGLRFIDFTARVSDPVGFAGSGVTVPFMNPVTPSRVVAAANASVIRITAQASTAAGIVSAEYWYDIPRGIWTGPHTFPSGMIDTYNGTFISAPVNIQGSLWQSDTVQSTVSTFTENGNAMTWRWQTSMLPDIGAMAEASQVETTLDLANVATASGLASIMVTAYDQNANIYDSAPIAAAGALPDWGAVTWGAFTWGGSKFALAPTQVVWDKAIVYRRLSICATGSSSSGIKLGALSMRVEPLGYLSQ